ncbi:haloacid dehalogenase-like hydrolase [Amycolatopsis sp. H20-H5]|uniref:haloacid dehalogenase-like hydrolase n=1 Tax=Amycolatopsis sp. H20-H5 TaxID=3046309 RepID=UPI002DB83E4B|nr:haloacid dehalogenase-like hydrolase [Amycolatopsis sp. H20-H5]MEC3977086.1 haloacid dehalogenase-like hydrolase [Amycolatopsis sp. H20-H5]
MRFGGVLAVAAAVLSLVTPVAAQADPARHQHCPQLSTDLAWYGQNRARLQELIDTGCGARGERPVAVFDWDNTVVRNDIGDAITYWMLRNDKIARPADWRSTSRYLTSDAAAALGAVCTGSPLRTNGADTRCADEILSVYSSGTTSAGKAAFAGWDRRRLEPQYAWAAQLLGGHTPAEIAAYTLAARRENLAAPIGTLQRVGSKRVTGWVRYYDQQRNLIGTLQRARFDVWIVSASPEVVAKVWAAGVGIAPDHVIGVRSTVSHGRQTYHLASCGGADSDSAITYIDGKRCWINQEIFGVHGPRAWTQRGRQVFAAGDSTTDVTFTGDARELRLVLNRNKEELMCHAYGDNDGKWLVNPMFLQPLPARTSLYPCSTSAYTSPTGAAAPVHRRDGSVIPDQRDSVSA